MSKIISALYYPFLRVGIFLRSKTHAFKLSKEGGVLDSNRLQKDIITKQAKKIRDLKKKVRNNKREEALQEVLTDSSGIQAIGKSKKKGFGIKAKHMLPLIAVAVVAVVAHQHFKKKRR